MSQEEHQHSPRRALDRAVYLYPLITGVCVALVGLGGYIATVKYVCDDLKSVHVWIEGKEKIELQQRDIMTRLTTLQEGQEKRISRLEDWHDHPFQLHSQRHSDLSNMRDDVDGRDG